MKTGVSRVAVPENSFAPSPGERLTFESARRREKPSQ
jgi:hypothetical protein